MSSLSKWTKVTYAFDSVSFLLPWWFLLFFILHPFPGHRINRLVFSEERQLQHSDKIIPKVVQSLRNFAGQCFSTTADCLLCPWQFTTFSRAVSRCNAAAMFGIGWLSSAELYWVVLYCCETWVLEQAFGTKCVRKLLRISCLKHKTNDWVQSKINSLVVIWSK